MSDKDRIENLEHRVDYLESIAMQILLRLNKCLDRLNADLEKEIDLKQSDCPWK